MQAVAHDQVLEPAAQLGEGEVDALGVELLVELAQHLGGGDVDVGDGLALQDDPAGPAAPWTRARTWSRNWPLLAKKSGASHRNTTTPGS